MFNCKFCKKPQSELSNFASHVRWCTLNPTNKRKKPKTLCCSKCGNYFSLLSPHDRRKTCSIECQYKLSSESKEKISVKIKQFLTDNPDKHVWKRNDKFKSVPCENVKLILKEKNIAFVEEFRPLKNRFYSLDIAFPHLKIGVEINGNQHYNRNGTLKEYYQKRHDEIERDGWKIIEIHYSQCFDRSIIESFLNFDVQNNTEQQIEYVKFVLNKDRTPEINKEKIKSKAYLKWHLKKDNIFDAGIDFSKFGWVNKVADVLDISPQKVGAWMKKYHPEFYNTQCYKRKSI